MTRRRWSMAGVVLLTACTTVTMPDDAPTHRGTIVAREDAIDAYLPPGSKAFMLEVGGPCGTVFTIDDDTRVARQWMSMSLAADVKDLRVGRTVKVWAPDGITLTCPGRGYARAVELID